ncbi:hypothetical protein LTR66_001295 [Elasticomyces elasticus]|nr:hypothetical protein LTR66_001295 [Elasticomyces elasticus]
MASAPPTPTPTPTLLTLPAELRNQIYLHIFTAAPAHPRPASPPSLDVSQDLPTRWSHCIQASPSPPAIDNNLQILLTSRQIHTEASLLALSLITFTVPANCTYPEPFTWLLHPLSASQIASLRHFVLGAKISSLRALNEAWRGLPFGHAGLRLDTLTVVPSRPERYYGAYAEVADLSQSHTLAYVLGETFKSLRNVRRVRVVNAGYFRDVLWRLVYRSLVYRIWRWGGSNCGLGFCEGGDLEGEEGQCWFDVWLGDEDRWEDGVVGCGKELRRLLGDEAEDAPNTVAGDGHGDIDAV